jgi:predicted nucleotidyltransferase
MKTPAKKEWRTSPRGSTGVTDNDWFAFLSRQPGIDEVNFSQTSGSFTS